MDLEDRVEGGRQSYRHLPRAFRRSVLINWSAPRSQREEEEEVDEEDEGLWGTVFWMVKEKIIEGGD